MGILSLCEDMTSCTDLAYCCPSDHLKLHLGRAKAKREPGKDWTCIRQQNTWSLACSGSMKLEYESKRSACKHDPNSDGQYCFYCCVSTAQYSMVQ